MGTSSPAQTRRAAAAFGRIRSKCAALLLLALLGCLGARPAAAIGAAPGGQAGAWTPCPRCALLLGAGTTFWPWHWTDGIVFPVMIEIDRSRFELGAFRFATRQFLKEAGHPPSTVSAYPYWGFSAMRRWQILHRSRMKLYVGIGAAYRTQTDLLESTRWNFAYLFAIRYSLGTRVFVEASVRHWSNAWIMLPNRGQNFLALAVGLR